MRSWRGVFRAGSGVLSAVVAAGLWAAAPAAPPPATAAPDSDTPTAGSILVIMDVSGSMDREDDGGTTLIDGARQAVNGLVDELPDETRVGLRLYGHSYPGEDEGPGCRDTELVVPIGAVGETGGQLRRAVESADPTGFTPIGRALTSAADDFAPEGERTIVLVSDGEDTCGNPPPCRAARRLARQGVDVRVDTIGLYLQQNRQARRQLSCIADTTGGRFVDADSSGELAERLTQTSQRAVQRFRASGVKIAGGPGAPRAAAIDPGQAYVDDVRPGEARWYTLPAGTGQEIAVTLTEDGSTEYGCCLELSLQDPDFDRLARETTYNPDGTATSLRVASSDQGVSGAGGYFVVVELGEGEATSPVRYEFTVERSGTALEEGRPTESPSPTEATESPSATPTDEASDEGGATDEEDAEESDDAAAVSATDEGGTSPLVWVALALALLVLGAGAAVALLLRSLRKSS